MDIIVGMRAVEARPRSQPSSDFDLYNNASVALGVAESIHLYAIYLDC